MFQSIFKNANLIVIDQEKNDHNIYISSHQVAEFIFLPLESEHTCVTCFGQWEINKQYTSRGLKNVHAFLVFALSCCWEPFSYHENKPEIAYWRMSNCMETAPSHPTQDA